jgi:hypothetical protein
MPRRLGVVVGGTVTGVVIATVLAAIIVHRERIESGPSSAASAAGVSSASAVADADSAPLVETGARADRDALPQEESGSTSAAELTDAAEWDERYRTDDLFSFAQSAAVAAMNGDGRAAWLLSLVLVECKSVLLSADRRDRALRGSLAEPRLDDLKIQRCEGFRSAHPVDGLELPEEAKLSKYWRELAIAAGDGRAVASRAVISAATASADVDAATKANERARLMDDLRVAVASKDPEAIATLANVFFQPNVSPDPQTGIAWLVAACELGYDCSQTNPSLRHACVENNTCDGTTLPDYFQRSATAAEFAEAYAAGQDIAYNVRAGNWEGLQPHLVMRP